MKNNIHSGQCQQALLLIESESDLDSGNARGLQFGEEICGVLGLAEYQKAPGRLRIEKDVFHLGRNGVGYGRQFTEKLPVAGEAAGAEARAAVVESSRQKR